MDIINGWAANGKLVLFSTHDLYLLPAYDCQLLYLNPSQCSVTTSTTAEVKRVIDLIELG
jgi:ABC-type Mn2+/Zn2+ transport system ATPase subunit